MRRSEIFPCRLTDSRQKATGNAQFKNLRYCFLSAVILSLFLMMNKVMAQDSLVLNYKTFGLANDPINVIQNVAHLDSFYDSLHRLAKGTKHTVNIVHIGDSHIQADYLTHTLRKNFQEQFGNAGRGLIVPAKVAGSHDAFNVVTSSPITWNGKRCVYPEQPLPIGIGGITINTEQPNAILNVYMKDLWLDHSFNTITLFFQKDPASFYFSVKDTSNQELNFIGPFTNDAFENHSRIELPHAVSAISIETIKATPQQSQATIFGMSLENNTPGILYHAIGVNGAKYKHYNAAALLAKQTVALQPDVFIISLGTNEALDYPYLDKSFYQQVDKLITSLHTNNPVAKFILVTPQEVFRRRTRPNPGIATIRETIIQYAAENGLAFWDKYKVLGGENSAGAWRDTGLLRPDGVHLTREGYEYQGNLLYHAIMKGYDEYIRLRHP